ncbi:unnamed protein product, partial [Natator depressus]
GRAVVASHEKQLYAPAMKTFILNAIHWLEAGKGGKVGLGNNMQNLCPLLSQEKILCELADLEDNLCVYCCTANSDRGAEKMQEFVAEGGRLLIGDRPGHGLQAILAIMPLLSIPATKY